MRRQVRFRTSIMLALALAALGLTLALAGPPAMAQDADQPAAASTDGGAATEAASTDEAKPDSAAPDETAETTGAAGDEEPAPGDAANAEEGEASKTGGPDAAETEKTTPETGTEGADTKRDWRSNRWIILGVLLAVIVLPIALGNFFAKQWRMPDFNLKIALILFCILAGVAILVMGPEPKLGIDLRGGVILVYEIAEGESPDATEEKPGGEGGEEKGKPAEKDEEAAAPSQKVDMDKLIAAIVKRINPGGVKEVTVRQRGGRQIEIIVPEVEEAEVTRLEKIISSVGSLEFRILANDWHDASLIKKAKASNADKVFRDDGELWGWWVPVAKGKEKSFPYPEIAKRTREHDGEDLIEVLVVKDVFDVNGGYLDRAAESRDQQLRPCVSFTFDSAGGKLFQRLTSGHLPDEQQDRSFKLGIILDGYLHSAPAIRSTISQRGEITGDFTEQEVEDLVSVLNAGSLPTALNKTPVARMLTGPRLGSDTIAKGTVAVLVSLLLVLVFMLFYYRFSGVVACLALLMNLLMILAIMIAVKAAFTLPGIAGLVLTVGISVDNNVLIFERMREELARGSALRLAIRNGFGRATSAIVDANLTTLITATVLYIIGQDQIKGFAVTLWLGVVISMFTAIFCARVVFDVAERQRWISRLSMMKIVGQPNIDFLGKRHLWGGISLVVIVLGLVGVFFRGAGMLDIDFTGGVAVEVVFDKKMDIGTDIRAKLAPVLRDLSVSDVKYSDEEPGRRFMINTAIPPELANEPKGAELYLEQVKDQIEKTYPEHLVHYTLEVTVLSESPGGESEPAAAEPEPDDQTRRDLPPATLLASTDPSAVLLAQADPPGEGDAPSEPESAVPGAAAEKPADGEPAEPEAAAGGPSESEPAESEPAEGEPAEGEPAGEDAGEPAGSAAEETTQPPSAEPAESEAPPESEEAPSTGPELEPAEVPGAEMTEETPAETPGEAPAETAEPPATGPDESETPAESEERPSTEPEPEPEPAEIPGAEMTEEPSAETPGEVAAEPLETPAGEEPTETGETAAEATGETVLKLDFGEHKIDHDTLAETIRNAITAAGMVSGTVQFKLSNKEYEAGGNRAYPEWEVRISLPRDGAVSLFDQVKAEQESTVYFPSSNSIGGKVAGSTRIQGIFAILASLVCIVGYLWFRFQRVMYGLAAVVALVHDVLITLGMIAISAYVTGIFGFLMIEEFKIGLPVLAAFLTIIGYSLNDTIVVFDRIREVKGKAPRLTGEMINSSINQTLSRTLLTSFTTLIVVVILYIGGGQGIHTFAFSLVVGVIVGTYSSIFVASPVLYWMAQPARSKGTQ